MAVKTNHIKGGTSKAHSAFTLIELIVVIAIMSVIVLLPGIRFVSLLTKSSFKAQAHQFVTTMQAAVTAAAENGKKYEVIIDLVEQTYTLREITSPDLTEVLEEEIIAENDFGENCQVVYVLFDDLKETGQLDDDTLSLIAKFRAGRLGWQNGGKILLLDKNEQEYSVIVNRLNRTIILKRGDVELLMPKRENELVF